MSPPTPGREHGCFRGGCLGLLIGAIGAPIAWGVGIFVDGGPTPDGAPEVMVFMMMLPVIAFVGAIAGLLLGALIGTIEHLLRRPPSPPD